MSYSIHTTIALDSHPFYPLLQQLAEIRDDNYVGDDATPEQEQLFHAAMTAYRALSDTVDYQTGRDTNVSHIGALIGRDLHVFANFTATDAAEWVKIVRKEILSGKWKKTRSFHGQAGWLYRDHTGCRQWASLRSVIGLRKLARLKVDFSIG